MPIESEEQEIGEDWEMIESEGESIGQRSTYHRDSKSMLKAYERLRNL